MRKVKILVPVIILFVVLAAGCLPKFKDEVTAPSWSPEYVLPLAKGEIQIGDLLSEALREADTEIDPYTQIFSFIFDEEYEAYSIDEIPTMDHDLDFDIGPVWSGQDVIPVYSSFEENPFTSSFAPGSGSFGYADQHGYYTSARFNTMRLSDEASNKMDFKIETDAQLDFLSIQIVDSEGDQVGNDIIELPNLPAGEHNESISLALCEVPNNLDFIVNYSSSNSGTITILPSVGPLKIVEINLSDPVNTVETLGIELPDISIPEINPFSAFNLDSDVDASVTFASGRIDIIVDRQMADETKAFPFEIDFRILQDGQNIVETDPYTQDKYIDLTGKTFNINEPLIGEVSLNYSDPMQYDVYDNATNTIIPYQYDLSLNAGTYEIQRFDGDVSALIGDQWEIDLEDLGIDQAMQTIEYPEGIHDNLPEFEDIFLTIGFDNQTSLSGELDLAIKVYEGPTTTSPMLNSAEFAIELPARTSDYEFKLHEQDDYDTFLSMISSKPENISIDANLLLNDPGSDFYIEVGDYIKPSIHVALPLALTVPAGDYNLGTVYEEHLNEYYDSDVVFTDFIDPVTLHIDYVNRSTLALGTILTFIGSDGTTYPIDAKLYPAKLNSSNQLIEREGDIKVTLTSELFDILFDPEGYTLKVDALIPNDTGAPLTLTARSNDTIKLNLWINGKLNIDPSNMDI